MLFYFELKSFKNEALKENRKIEITTTTWLRKYMVNTHSMHTLCRKNQSLFIATFMTPRLTQKNFVPQSFNGLKKLLLR